MEKINITLRFGQKIFFTSDLHFGHRNILRFCERPFADVKEMTEELIKRWNSVVRPDDIVFHLGDFCWWTDRHGTKRLVERLNGKKHFVLGNHDELRQFELCEDITICSDITTLYVRPADPYDSSWPAKCYELICSHYPLLCASHLNNKNTYNLFGHIHSRKDQPMSEFGAPIKLTVGKQFDVGADRHDYTPIELFDLLKEIEEYPHWDAHK